MKKKNVIIILLILLLFNFKSIYEFLGKTLFCGIPMGYIDKEEYYQEDGFQDYIDYAKYIYPFKSMIIYNHKYEKITKDNIDKIKEYFLEFSFSLSKELKKVYDFDENIISEGDYVRIKCVKEYKDNLTIFGKYEDLEILYFDIETKTLYYISKFY